MVHARRCHILDAIRFERLPMTLNSVGRGFEPRPPHFGAIF